METQIKKNVVRRTIHNALLAKNMTAREMAMRTGIDQTLLMDTLWEMVDEGKVDAAYSFRRGEKGKVIYRLPESFYEMLGAAALGEPV